MVYDDVDDDVDVVVVSCVEEGLEVFDGVDVGCDGGVVGDVVVVVFER